MIDDYLVLIELYTFWYFVLYDSNTTYDDYQKSKCCQISAYMLNQQLPGVISILNKNNKAQSWNCEKVLLAWHKNTEFCVYSYDILMT